MRLRTVVVLRQKLRLVPDAYLQVAFADLHIFLVLPRQVIRLNTPGIIYYSMKKINANFTLLVG